MAGAQKQLQRQAPVETADTHIDGSGPLHESSVAQGPVPLALTPRSNLFHVYSGAGFAPVDRLGRPIPTLSTAPRPRPSSKTPEPAEAPGALEQFHDAMNIASLMMSPPPMTPVGGVLSGVDGVVYLVESAANWIMGDNSEAGLAVLGAGAGFAGMVVPEGRIPAKAAHLAAKETANLRRLAASARDVNSIEDRGFLIRSLGDAAKKDGPDAVIAIEALEEIAMRKGGDTLKRGADDYSDYVREATAMLVKADTHAGNRAVERILTESRSDLKHHIVNILVNEPSSNSQLLRSCVLKCADDQVQNYAIGALFTRVHLYDDDVARAALDTLLKEAAPKQRIEILAHISESFRAHLNLLEEGLNSSQLPAVRMQAASSMVDSIQHLGWDFLDTASLRTSLRKFRKEVEGDHVYSAIVQKIDMVLSVTP